ncbi:putative ATP-dependent RNA helicase DDX60 isoform X2 [Pelodiscus sinensis]|uniref:putative ATP-dependent RNA helicase DDX60 isoform X2 n=1 Tax=Pelodiscus sinensis TaxID=13735 RepID=UPI003F6C17B2
MASPQTDLKEDRSVHGSESDSSVDEESEATDSSLEHYSSLVEEEEDKEKEVEDDNHHDFSDALSVEESQQFSKADKEDSSILRERPDSPNPEQRECLGFLKKLSVFIWKSLSQAKYVSLLNDFVESEFFVIDGDALLLKYLCKKRQYLPFFYLIECFLLDFTQKGAKYVIVFFKDVEQMYFNYPNFLFHRTALIQHLKCNTDITIRTEFSNCFSPEWQIFLKECYPYFMIISDIGQNSLHEDYLHIFITHTLSKKINVVLTSGQESDALRVYGYYIQSVHEHRLFFHQHEKDLQHICEAIVKYLQKSQDTVYLYNLKLSLRNLQKEICQTILLLKNLWPEESNLRRVVCVLTCTVGLKMYSNMLENAKAFEETKKQTKTFSKEKIEALTLEEAADLCRMQCLSVVFLLNLPLSQRAQIRIINSGWTEQVLPFINMLQHSDYLVLKQLNDENDWKLDLTHLSDLRDNLLLKNLSYYYETEYCSGLNLELGKKMKSEYQYLWSIVTKLAANCNFGDAFPVRSTSQLFLQQKKMLFKESKEDIPNIGLIPMKSNIVEDYVGAVLESLPILSSNDPEVTSLIKQTEFDELRHWHSGKPLSDEYDRTKCSHDAKSKSPEERRRIQKLQSYYQLYGRSLEGNISKTIVTQVDEPLVLKSTNAAVTKAKRMHKSKAEIIAEENQKRLNAKEEKKEQEQWSVLFVLIEKEIKHNFTHGINRLENFLKTCKSNSVKFTAEMTGLNVCLEVWKEHCRNQGRKSRDLSIAVQVMRRVHVLLDKYQELLKKTHIQKLAKCLKYLGFENLACSLSSQIIENDNEKLAKYSTEMGAARFQLQYMGYYLFREERKDPDPRIQHFIPDTWQRELLDVVDNNESAVIVAPTSSGKTYASYYCMEKVLRESNEGVVVYVSPTKALVNQVMGTVYNRFTKTLPHGLVVGGIFTRDYRHDTLNCQILVTVPQCLEILLLSPHRQEWVKRIRYVIFDEVHCLGGEIGAEVWEHLLVMIQCPFLALSATISNPEYLTEWLQSVKRYWQLAESTIEESPSSCTTAWKGTRKPKLQKTKKSYRVRLVLHGDRYNDLEKYVCSLRDNNFIIDHYHPCAALTVNHIENYGIPSDIAFSPRESIQLYDMMAKVWQEWPKLQELDPEEFTSFKNKIVITRTNARNYEQELKKELINWIVLGQREKVSQLLESLKPHPVDCSENEKRIRFAQFVEKLQDMDKLPAIFFINLKKESATKHERMILTWNEKQYLKKRLKKLTEVPPDCTYVNSKAVDNETLMNIFHRIRFQRKRFQLRMLAQRGIGYHHASMAYKEKQVVEMLFRMGYIRVVTATGSLALGINMPCKSVVFTEDSIFLDALNYRQMSGRAGRRGQDMIGNVFFYDIPLPKVEKLIKSNVPQLRGQFPLSISLVLRLMLLAAKADDKADARAKDCLCHAGLRLTAATVTATSGEEGVLGETVAKGTKEPLPDLGAFELPSAPRWRPHRARLGCCHPLEVLSVLKHSLLSFKQERNAEMLKVYFIFSLQFLVKEGYLDQECNPMGFTGLVSHLYYHEPSNFVLVSFLLKGLFHKLCQPIENGSAVFSEAVMVQLVLVLANLFGRRYLPACATKFRTSCQSKVFLEHLPEEFSAAVHEYNCKIKKNFGCFLLTVAKLADMEQEYQLPLSRIDFTHKECDNSELTFHLMKSTKSIASVSPFTCLSGIVDEDLFDADNGNEAVLRTIGVNVRNAPLCWLEKYDNQGRRMPLNAYALDFFKHGSLVALKTDNWLNEGDAYNLLKDFSLLIKAIRTSLGEICDDPNDNVVLAFQQLSESYSAKLAAQGGHTW